MQGREVDGDRVAAAGEEADAPLARALDDATEAERAELVAALLEAVRDVALLPGVPLS